jgi:hypothetical protein
LSVQQVDAEYKLQDTIKVAKEWEMKVKGFRKKLDAIQTILNKHMDQYVIFLFFNDRRMFLLGSTIGSCWDRPSALLPINRRLYHL